ncbi:MAG: SDR family oxidoreductase, partial [Mycobacterium sp.]
LAAAAERIGGVETVAADALDRDAVSRVFEEAGSVDMVIISVGGDAKAIGPFLELDLDGVKAAFEQKAIAQLRVAQVAAHNVNANGSITFVSAASARSAIQGAVGSAAVSGAVEGAILSLAAELAPIRVNAVSPGLIDTQFWDYLPAEVRTELLSSVGEKLPLRRPGQAIEVAEIIAAVAKCGYVTGSIYEVDGGGGRIASL